jgi:hypothetical protein
MPSIRLRTDVEIHLDQVAFLASSGAKKKDHDEDIHRGLEQAAQQSSGTSFHPDPTPKSFPQLFPTIVSSICFHKSLCHNYLKWAILDSNQ